MAKSETGNTIELGVKDSKALFFIGSYGVMVRDVIWLLTIVSCSAIVLLSMLIKGSVNALNAISAASTLLSIVLSFIAIIKSMIDSSDATRVNAKTEASLQNLDSKILDLFKELDVHKENEEVLKNNMERAISLLSLLSNAYDENKKREVVERLSDEKAIEEINNLCDYFTKYLN